MAAIRSASMDNRCRFSMNHDRVVAKKMHCSSTKKGKERECCMCGDVGFQERLFRCHKCHYRFQHIYCSRLFIHLESNVKVCDWCLDLEAQNAAKEKNLANNKRKLEVDNREAQLEPGRQIHASRSVSDKEPALKQQPGSKHGLKINIKFGGMNSSCSGHDSAPQHSHNSSKEDKFPRSVENCRNVPSPNSVQNSPTKGLGRRYKLLSDVLC